MHTSKVICRLWSKENTTEQNRREHEKYNMKVLRVKQLGWRGRGRERERKKKWMWEGEKEELEEEKKE